MRLFMFIWHGKYPLRETTKNNNKTKTRSSEVNQPCVNHQHPYVCIHAYKPLPFFICSPGSYVFMEASDRKYGDKARLISDWLEPNKTMCLQFWYHMQGKDVGKLNVYITANFSQNQIWSQEGNQGNRWLFAQVPIYHVSPYKVRIGNFSLAVNLDSSRLSFSHTLHLHHPNAYLNIGTY